MIDSLKVLSQTDIMLALDAPGVLYLEDYTDLEILREWARMLGHPAYEPLGHGLFWKTTVSEPRPGRRGSRRAITTTRSSSSASDLPGLELVDGDAHPEIQATPITGPGLQRLRWRRYEIESYLVHPEALARFVEHTVGTAPQARPTRRPADPLRRELSAGRPADPTRVTMRSLTHKARTRSPPAGADGGRPAGLPYTRYHEIAAVMRPEEIHPGGREKLDGIVRAFGQ